MKNYLLPLLLFILISLSSFGQRREINVDGTITGITIANKAKVHLSNGPQKVEVLSSADSTQQNIALQNGTLRIGGAASELYITLPDLQRIDISGVGNFTSDTLFTVNNLRIDITGIGKIILPLKAQRLQAGISGMGKLQLTGSAENVELNISGNGRIDALNFRTTNCIANVSGMTKTYMDVTGVLDLNISGTGKFFYKASPAQVNASISGIGNHGVYTPGADDERTIITLGGMDIIIVDSNKNDKEAWAAVTDTIIKKPQYSRSHWMGIDLGFNYLAYGSGLSSSMPDGLGFLELNSGKSVNVNVNIFAHDFKLYKRYVMFTTGIGLTLNNYRFDSDMTLRKSKPLTADYDTLVNGTRITYDKNKLAVNYVTVPLLLQFNTHELNKKSIHFATGILASYKYNSHLKLVYDDVNGDRDKEKRQGEYNIQPFRADLTFRAGYKNWTLYASYAMTELFRNRRGPEVHPVQFGISFIGW